jgi:hypothetical protein
MVKRLIETGMSFETAKTIVDKIERGFFPTGLNLTVRQAYIIGWF